VGLLQLVEDLEAAHLRQHHVEYHGVEGLLAGQGQALRAVLGQHHVVARLREQGLEDVAHDLLVVHDEDRAQALGSGHRSAAASAGRSAGSVTWKVVPWPGTLSTKIAPPCSWRMP